MKLAPFILAAAALLAGCGRETPDYQPSIGEAERRFGAEQHPLLLAEFGGAYDAPQAAYVARVGERVADAAGLPGQCNFTLVNSDVVNAFAVPGCYIYVTRGLLGLVNSEAELASILGHELGHIVADHSERQQRGSILRQLGVVAVGLVTNSETLTRLAGQAAELFTLRYSRGQEYESDDLGIRYTAAAGYDPHEAADMLAALTRHEAFSAGAEEGARGMPEWARTHPLTENRIERARRTAGATGIADDALPEGVDAYLRAVDGMLYGDDPEQGFVLGRRFLHPQLGIAFEAPPGFTLTNSPQAVLLEGPGGLRGEFGGGAMARGGLDAYVDSLLGQMLGQTPVEIGTATRAVTNGLPTLILPVRIATPQGAADLLVAAYDGGGGAAWHFIIASSDSAAGLSDLLRSFRLLSPAEARALRPRAIDVVTVPNGATVAALAARMASDRPVERFLMLNGRTADQPLRPGEPVKIIVFADRG